MPFIGLTSLGRIVTQAWNGVAVGILGPSMSVNLWTHIVQTFSVTNGITMYINGAYYNSTKTFSYSASGKKDTIILANYISGASCSAGQVVAGQYYGAIDEFRLYSRELTTTDVYELANV
ncbi:unnamed protein product [Didymodactylos carnosus]|nr:unnamed protein product [Didymodactylos carnosus]CAF4323500.1 unnamed protein product [Didymodactylos carnosus]